MKLLLTLLTLAVLVLHQDFWFWGDRQLVFGFMPVGLVYHVGYTLAVVALMVLLVRFAWPGHLEASVAEDEGAATSAARGGEGEARA